MTLMYKNVNYLLIMNECVGGKLARWIWSVTFVRSVNSCESGTSIFYYSTY